MVDQLQWLRRFIGHRTDDLLICMIYSHYSSWPRSARQGGYIPDLYDQYDLYDLYDLYGLGKVAGWGPYNLYDLARMLFPGLDVTVVYRSCTACHNDRLGSRWSRSWSAAFVKSYPSAPYHTISRYRYHPDHLYDLYDLYDPYLHDLARMLFPGLDVTVPVSYTHLTLPTKA